jgi:hypothetical protein
MSDQEEGLTAVESVGLTAVEPAAPLTAMTRQMRVLTANVGQLRDQVRSGQLSLDPAAGQEILALLTEQMDQVDGWLQRGQGLARRAPLGANPVGEAMAAKFETRAGGDTDTSFTGVLTPYRQVLQDAHDAVNEAMQKYQAVEQDQADHFQRIIPWG